jgi:hypothetical protein
VVARGETFTPGEGPDLEEVDFFIGFVLFGVCDS